MIDRASELTVTLAAQQWEAVLNALADGGPYRVVAPLIADIQRQCMQQSNAAPSDYHGSVDARDQRGNGEMSIEEKP